MLRENLSRYLRILQKNLWLSHGVNMLLAFLFLALAPIIVSINDLTYSESARITEQYVSVIGIFLLTPIFRPESDHNIREVVESKYTWQIGIYLTRIGMAAITIILFTMGFIFCMKTNNSMVLLWEYIFATSCTALFLGSMGLLAYGISDQLILGYMIPLGYILLNMFTGQQYVKKFYLYSLMKESMEEKNWLLAGAALMILVTLTYKWLRKKRRYN